MMMMKRGAQQSRQKTSDLNFNVVFVPPRCSFVAHIHSEKNASVYHVFEGKNLLDRTEQLMPPAALLRSLMVLAVLPDCCASIFLNSCLLSLHCQRCTS